MSLALFSLALPASAESWTCSYDKPVMNDYMSGSGNSEEEARSDLKSNLNNFGVNKISASSVKCKKATSASSFSSVEGKVMCQYDKPVMNDYMSADGATKKEAIRELKKRLANFEVDDVDEEDISCKDI